MRLNKFISETGVCSRREADQWIEQGRVTINGQPALLGTQVDGGDEVRVNGKLLGAKKKDVYIALNKPVGITCTTERHVEGNIVDFVGHRDRIFPIGRLDKDSEGLILLTNNGDIVNEILRSEHNHEKEYIVTVDKPITLDFIREMASGVRILDTVTKPCKVSQIGKNRFQIILTQGLNRQIRRMCEAFDYQVRSLKRIRIMNVHLDGIASGQWRDLSPSELNGLLPKLVEAPAPMASKSSPWGQSKRTLSLKPQAPRNSHK
jgi:23S rRNA pseudouridine2604 synthase